MSLRVAVTAELLISQDDATTPSEPSFDSGLKKLIDDASYSYHIGDTIRVLASAVDQAVYLGSLVEADILYFQAQAIGLSLKLVPVGGTQGACSALPLVAGVPSVIGAQILAVYVSNSTLHDLTLVIGAAGN